MTSKHGNETVNHTEHEIFNKNWSLFMADHLSHH